MSYRQEIVGDTFYWRALYNTSMCFDLTHITESALGAQTSVKASGESVFITHLSSLVHIVLNCFFGEYFIMISSL